MPLVDGLAAVTGGQASASPVTDREGIPEGRGYTSAHLGRGPDSEST